jgi:hypothetical protein
VCGAGGRGGKVTTREGEGGHFPTGIG